MLGREALEKGNARTALQHFLAGQEFPDYLGELPSEAETIHLLYYSGLAYSALGESDQARQAFDKVVAIQGDPSIVTFYQGLALKQLGQPEPARARLLEMLNQVRKLANNPPGSNFFYYGNPSPVFEDDPKKLQQTYYTYLVGMACLGLDDRMGARSALGQVLAIDPTRLLAYEEYKRL